MRKTKDAMYLGVTDAISRTDASGFLYPTSESEKAWFTFQSPYGTTAKTGPLETGDIVEIRGRDKSDSADLGFLMKGVYADDDDEDADGNVQKINQEIQRVPGLALRKEEPDVQINQAVKNDDGRFLQFRVEILGTT